MSGLGMCPSRLPGGRNICDEFLKDEYDLERQRWKGGGRGRDRTWLGECEGMGGLQEEQANKRKGNKVRWRPDEESLTGHGGVWVLS